VATWAKALEGEGDLQDVIEKSWERMQRRTASKLIREGGEGSVGRSAVPSGRSSPVVEDRRKGKKGRKSQAVVEEFEVGASGAGKKKQGVVGKAGCVTWSLLDDGDKSRDAKRRKTKPVEIPLAVKEKMKKAPNECYKAMQACEEAGTRRRRWELVKEQLDKRDYPYYY